MRTQIIQGKAASCSRIMFSENMQAEKHDLITIEPDTVIRPYPTYAAKMLSHWEIWCKYVDTVFLGSWSRCGCVSRKGSNWKETGMVFTKDYGEWLHPGSITRWLNNLSRDNGLPHIHPHAFRHTGSSTMIANGVDLVTTAAELGHANANTTATIYAHQIAIARATSADVRAGVIAGRK